MTPARWQQVEEVLQAVLDCPGPQRAGMLNTMCAGDLELQSETMSLLEAHEAAGEYLEQSVLERDALVLIEDDGGNRAGTTIGSYEIIERLGSGGMGEVYLARDERLGRRVALKILPPYFVFDGDRLRRFQTEARAASALNHANILTVYEVGQSDDVHFIATEYIEGQTIRELIESASLSLGDVVDIAIQVGTGLSAAHSAGIVHRDIKPDNIMQREDGAVRVLDFGIAKLIEGPTNEVSTLTSRGTGSTELGAVLGTIAYVSPEQARGLMIDERTDLWSCGVVLYEMLSGRRPFLGATNADTIVAILERQPAPLFGTEPRVRALAMLQRIVDKALNKNVKERYQTASEMLADLNGVKLELGAPRHRKRGVSPEASIAEVQALANTHTAFSRRNAFLMSAVVILALAFIVAAILYRRKPLAVAANSSPPIVYTQLTEAQQLQFIDEQEQRISSLMGERPVKLNDEALRAIRAQIDRYVAPPKPGGESLAATYGRAGPYIPVIDREFSARRIPIVIGIYLPMIESAYRPCFENEVGAKGLFQFLPSTAEHYGVARRDMCDVNKMAPAAAHYIADRMAELGDDAQSMTLVLLSYNRGSTAVLDALRLLRETDVNYERNFWTLFANRDKLDQTFQQESAYYVPAFFAAAIIGENPQAFGLNMPPLSSQASRASTSDP